MSVFMMCEKALGLLNASDLRDLGDDNKAKLESLDYDGLVNDQAQPEAVACARHFANIRDRLLQLHPWVFARKTAAPAQLSSPLSGWRFAYAIPSDCLRILALIDTPHHGDHDHEHHHHHSHYHRSTGAMILGHWEQVGRDVVCCNHKNIQMRYTAQIKNTDLWDPSFADVFCATLASEIANSVCGNPKIAMTAAQIAAAAARESIQQAHRTGAVSEAHELPQQETLWMDYSGITTGFDDHGRWGY